jgi:hypothetical protein
MARHLCNNYHHHHQNTSNLSVIMTFKLMMMMMTTTTTTTMMVCEYAVCFWTHSIQKLLANFLLLWGTWKRLKCLPVCGWDDVMQVCGAISILRRVWQWLGGVIGGQVHTLSRRLHLSGEQWVRDLCYTFIGDCHTVRYAEQGDSRFYLDSPGKSQLFSSKRSRLFFQAILNSHFMKYLKNT